MDVGNKRRKKKGGKEIEIMRHKKENTEKTLKEGIKGKQRFRSEGEKGKGETKRREKSLSESLLSGLGGQAIFFSIRARSLNFLFPSFSPLLPPSLPFILPLSSKSHYCPFCGDIWSGVNKQFKRNIYFMGLSGPNRQYPGQAVLFIYCYFFLSILLQIFTMTARISDG